jgi:hypothetical protein
MLDRQGVQVVANDLELYSTVIWIEDNPRDFAKGIMHGFDVAADPWSVEQVIAYYQGDGRVDDMPRIEGLDAYVRTLAAELAAEVRR